MSGSPWGYEFHGRMVKYDWGSVEHLLGKKTDVELARRLGCHRRSVAKTRKLLGVPRFRKADLVRPLLGLYPDLVVARRCGVAEKTVTRQRLAEGIPPAPRASRRDAARARHARRMAALEEKG